MQVIEFLICEYNQFDEGKDIIGIFENDELKCTKSVNPGLLQHKTKREPASVDSAKLFIDLYNRSYKNEKIC